MNTNMASIDRWARAVLGLVIGAVGLHFRSWLGLIGLLPLGIALVGGCPAYVPFGMSTCLPTAEGDI